MSPVKFRKVPQKESKIWDTIKVGTERGDAVGCNIQKKKKAENLSSISNANAFLRATEIK